MREIKFRGKMLDSDDWVCGYYILCPKIDLIFKNKIYCDDINKLVDVIYDTIGQYTGVKDKNGEEIYEGDILKIPEWLQQDSQDKCICVYAEEHQTSEIIGFGLYIKDGYSGEYKILVPSDEWDEFQVIGNIYDNPELLEE